MEQLLEILICPVTGEGGLVLEGSVEDGVLRTPSGRLYPVIQGVPRMLPPTLLGPFMGGAFPEFLERWPELAAALEEIEEPEVGVLETLGAFGYHHVELGDQEIEPEDWLSAWDRFQPGVPLSVFEDERVLEVGSGEGRHTWLVGEHARLIVGLDLSRGVEVARRRDQRSNSFYVQGDLRYPPFRKGCFDALYSNGVLHHTPEPTASFEAVAPLVRRGGRVYVWVYGLEEMRWSYRMSHLRWLRPLSNRLPHRGKRLLTGLLTVAVEVGLWFPTRMLRRMGMARLAKRLPYHDAANKDWRYKFRRMFDRISPPITFYISSEELRQWFAEFSDVQVVKSEGQGWAARGIAK